jgi:hypothetical protein
MRGVRSFGERNLRLWFVDTPLGLSQTLGSARRIGPDRRLQGAWTVGSTELTSQSPGVDSPRTDLRAALRGVGMARERDVLPEATSRLPPHLARSGPSMSDDDKYLDVLEEIETGLKKQYELNPTLTDVACAFALDQSKIAVKQKFGFAKNESCRVDPVQQGIVDWCVDVAARLVDESNGPSVKEYLARVEKVARSVRRHSSDGERAYYLFIREFLP